MTSQLCLCRTGSLRLPHRDIQWSGGKRASIWVNKVPGMAGILISLLLISMNCQYFALRGV
jgi:hypothetical protein